jgi:hypothetical protein
MNLAAKLATIPLQNPRLSIQWSETYLLPCLTLICRRRELLLGKQQRSYWLRYGISALVSFQFHMIAWLRGQFYTGSAGSTFGSTTTPPMLSRHDKQDVAWQLVLEALDPVHCVL